MNNEFLQHFAEPYHKMGENSLIPTKLSNEFQKGGNSIIPTKQNSSMNNEFLYHFDEPYSKMGANKLIPTNWKKNKKHQNDDTINTNT